MRLRPIHARTGRQALTRNAGVLVLIGLAGMAVAGPSGILAWGENARLLEQREHEVARLKAEQNELRNRVDLLDPRHTDPDLAGELLRSNLNVVHPDEMVMLLKN